MTDAAIISFAQLMEGAHKMREATRLRREGEEWRQGVLDRTSHLSTDSLKAAWDRYDGTDQEGDPTGEDIYFALNLRGCRGYAVV